MQNQMYPTGKPVKGQKAGGELHRAVRVRPLGGNPRCWPGLEQKRRGGDAGSQATETAAQAATKVEHTEVKPCGRLDEDATSIGHSRSGAPSPPAPLARRSCPR